MAPGGTLLVVGHDLSGHDQHDHGRHRVDPTNYVQPPDVAQVLDERSTIEVDERRERTAPPGHPLGDVADLVLRARKA